MFNIVCENDKSFRDTCITSQEKYITDNDNNNRIKEDNIVARRLFCNGD